MVNEDEIYPKSINTKKDMRNRQLRGEFGNVFRFWRTPQEVKESGYKGEVWFCQSERFFGPVTMDVPPEEVANVYEKWLKMGEEPKFIQIGESPPLEWRRLNAEVQLTPQGLTLTYNTKPAIHHREAMLDEEKKVVVGLQAKRVLQEYMDPQSYEDLRDLLDRYGRDNPSYSNVVELHCFDRNVGTVPHRNSIIGEVRNY